MYQSIPLNRFHVVTHWCMKKLARWFMYASLRQNKVGIDPTLLLALCRYTGTVLLYIGKSTSDITILLLMKTHPYFVSYVLHCMFCVCTRTSSFFAYLQMTLLIHVNSMTAFNASHFLNSETWHMISIIGHQRRLTSVILKRLTSENCHQSIITTLIHCLQECCYPLRHEWPGEHLFHLQ